MELRNSSPAATSNGHYDRDNLMKEAPGVVLHIMKQMDIRDNGFQGREDMVERIILSVRKARGDLNKPYDKFLETLSDTEAKCNSLIEIMKQLYSSLGKIPTGPLSEVLLEERLLKHADILEETPARMQALEQRQVVIIFAGETNGGKSTCLNVVLGEEILPTDVLHCTLAVTKIIYSETYSIDTLDHYGTVETHHCAGTKEAYDLLKVLVALRDQKARLQGSKYKEITLKMPAAILKSGVMLVDTPGIGEMEEMDNVTMSYIKSTRADGFIYIIKSDTAGGVQEDRLVSFLKAIQEDYKKDSVESAIDPRAAMFVCNRWDTIEEVEIVKKNALTKLDIVWPGFTPEQAHFFSSKQAKLHVDADPEFITDKLNELLIGMNKLFKRVAHNNVQNQYKWIKFILPAASRHLSSMINHCITGNEELEDLFRSVAAKQEILMKKSKEQGPDLRVSLGEYKVRLKAKFREILENAQAEDLDDYDQLTSIITEKFLEDSKNKKEADEWFIHSLLKHCDTAIQKSGLLDELENETKSKIQEHIGLFTEQMQEITELVKGRAEKGMEKRRLSSQSASFENSQGSSGGNYTAQGVFELETMNPEQLSNAVVNLLKRKKKGKMKFMPNITRKVISAIQLGGSGGKAQKGVAGYVSKRVAKYAAMLKDTDESIEALASGYLQLIELYIQSAVEHIPHFIGVNNKLMDNIRDHRRIFQENKENMKTVMDELERCREQLRGYGLLYMEDLNADNVSFNTDKRDSNVNIDNLKLDVSRKNQSTDFRSSGSSRNKIRGFWTQSVNAVIKIDEVPSEIILKSYTTPIDNNTELSEIASLRYLGHKNLAPFFGMTRIACTYDDSELAEKVSGFIFKGSLVSARVFKNNRLIVQSDFQKSFVSGLISGLEYIHRENMVHLELNLDTVMVNFESGIVQLCQQCKPRCIQLPEDLSVTTKSSVCLSLPVLQGAEYGINDDIYAFALLLWELLFPNNPPFAQERKWSLEKFINDVRPSQMLGLEIDKLEASEAVLAVFRGALLTGRRSHCMTTGDIKSRLDELYTDPVFNRNSRSRRTPVKKGSRESFEDLPQNPSRASTSSNEMAVGESGELPVRPPRPRKAANQRNRALSLQNESLFGSAGNISDLQRHLREFGTGPQSRSSDASVSARDQQSRLRKQSAPVIRFMDCSPQGRDQVYKSNTNDNEDNTNLSSGKATPATFIRTEKEQFERKKKISDPGLMYYDQGLVRRETENTTIVETRGERFPYSQESDDAPAMIELRRKFSTPDIAALDVMKLQKIHEERKNNEVSDEDCDQNKLRNEPEEINQTPPDRSRNRNRRTSLPNISISTNDQEQLAKRLRKNKKGSLGALFKRKSKQPEFNENDANIALSKDRSLYSSVPDNINKLPKSKSPRGIKNTLFRLFRGDRSRNSSQERTSSSIERLGKNGKKEDSSNAPNLVSLASSLRQAYADSKRSSAFDDEDSFSDRLSLDGSGRFLAVSSRSAENSPTRFLRTQERNSSRSNSSVESLAERIHNGERHINRNSSSSSLFSLQLPKISEMRVLANGDESPSIATGKGGRSMSTPNNEPDGEKSEINYRPSSDNITFQNTCLDHFQLPSSFLPVSKPGASSNSSTSVSGALPLLNSSNVNTTSTSDSLPGNADLGMSYGIPGDDYDFKSSFHCEDDSTTTENNLGGIDFSASDALPSTKTSSLDMFSTSDCLPSMASTTGLRFQSGICDSSDEENNLADSGLSVSGAIPSANTLNLSGFSSSNALPSLSNFYGDGFATENDFQSRLGVSSEREGNLGSSGFCVSGALPSRNASNFDSFSTSDALPRIPNSAAGGSSTATGDIFQPGVNNSIQDESESDDDSFPFARPNTSNLNDDDLTTDGALPSINYSGTKMFGDGGDFVDGLSASSALPTAPRSIGSSGYFSETTDLPALCLKDMSFMDQ